MFFIPIPELLESTKESLFTKEDGMLLLGRMFVFDTSAWRYLGYY